MNADPKARTTRIVAEHITRDISYILVYPDDQELMRAIDHLYEALKIIKFVNAKRHAELMIRNGTTKSDKERQNETIF